MLLFPFLQTGLRLVYLFTGEHTTKNMATTKTTDETVGGATGTQTPNNTTESPPGDEENPPGEPRLTESAMLQQMYEFLGKIAEHLPIGDSSGEKQRAKAPRRRHISEHSTSDSDEVLSSSEPPVKRTRAADGDSISVTASDEDIRQLLDDPPGQTSEQNNANDQNGEDELLKELEAALNDEKEMGASVNQQLADIVNKRWGVKLNQDKLAAILAKHPQPENCSAVNVTRVNPEIWRSLNAFERNADLRIANIQQGLQKATFANLSSANELLALKTTNKTPTKEIVNNMLANSIDTLALLGHAVSELSQLRREKLKPALKPEYHSLCTAPAQTESRLLFGDDLAKQIRDKNETNRIGHAVALKSKRDTSESRPSHSWHNKQHNFKHNSSSYSQPPFRKGYHRGGKRKKQTNYVPTERGKK